MKEVKVVIKGREQTATDVIAVCEDDDAAQMVVNNEEPKLNEDEWINVSDRTVISTKPPR